MRASDLLNDIRKSYLDKEEKGVVTLGSGWTFKEVKYSVIKMKKYKLTAGGSYIPLPTSIQESESCINVKNTDQKCFLWSLLAIKHDDNHIKKRLSFYEKHEDEIIIPKHIQYPH